MMRLYQYTGTVRVKAEDIISKFILNVMKKKGEYETTEFHRGFLCFK